MSNPDILNSMKGKQSVVFQSGNSMAVRLVGECRLPRGTRIRRYRDRGRIIIEPISEWPEQFIEALGAYRDEIPRADDEGTQRDPFAPGA